MDLDEVVVESLKQEDVDGFEKAKDEITKWSRTAAQSGMRLAENIASAVLAVNKGDIAQTEYLRLIERRAKKSGYHYCGKCDKDEVADLDLTAKTITFKKRKKDA